MWKWSDQICVSRHQQPICMGCCGNDIAYVRWRLGFPTQKHQKKRSIISPSKQSRCQVVVVLCIVLHTAQPHWCTSVTLDLTSSLCVALRMMQKILWNQIWVARASRLRCICKNPHFKPPPNVAWIRFAKIAFHEVFCCPDFLKSIWIQSRYAKVICTGSLNKALEANTSLDNVFRKSQIL